MALVFIKESKEKNDLKFKMESMINKIYITKCEEKFLIILPINENTKDKKMKKISMKLSKILYNINAQEVVLSRKLQNNSILKNELYTNNLYILDGRKLFKILSYCILEKIYRYKKKSIRNAEITILVNDNDNMNIDIILEIAMNVKMLNIVTNNLNNFKRIEEYLYEEKGISIRISNNKSRDLLTADVILNIDFPEEIINKYAFPSKGIIINFNENVKINSKRFNGININYYSIVAPNDLEECIKYENTFEKEKIYESVIYKMNFIKAKEKIRQDKIEIDKLIGNKGPLNEKEFI